jgi:RND family efflux transporter MFP subunit
VKARLAVAEAEERQAAAMVGYLTVRAPFDGVVTARNVDPGRLVQMPTSSLAIPLLTVMQANVVRLFVEVPEADAVLVENGAVATIRVPALPDQTFEGTVTRSSWSLEASNRTLRTELDLPNDHQLFRPGMFANVQLTLAQRSNALVVPRAAVVTIAGKPTCLVVGSDGTIIARPVQIGLRTPTELEIVSGLTADETVISANASAFRPGQKVAIAGN